MNILQLAQDCIYAAKAGTQNHAFRFFNQVQTEELIDQLDTDDKRKAFWINLYNAIVIDQVEKNPSVVIKRHSFYKLKLATFQTLQLSLDEIEHGILRRSQISWGLGYLVNPFPKVVERKLRVNHPDFRVHFALNCGATSCPPVSFYDYQNIDKQLDLAMRSYLESEVVIVDENTISVPRIFQWYIGDFKGPRGIRQLLKSIELVDTTKSTKLRFKKYDWTIIKN